MGYLKSLTKIDDIEIVPGNLQAYDDLLAATHVDVVGTRLHGGIRGLMHGRRVLVTSIDNRARDIGVETGLPTVARDVSEAELEEKLGTGLETQLTLPTAKIEQFMGQFNEG